MCILELLINDDGFLCDVHSNLIIKNTNDMPKNVLLLNIQNCYKMGKHLNNDLKLMIEVKNYHHIQSTIVFINNNCNHEFYEYIGHFFCNSDPVIKNLFHMFQIDQIIERTKEPFIIYDSSRVFENYINHINQVLFNEIEMAQFDKIYQHFTLKQLLCYGDHTKKSSGDYYIVSLKCNYMTKRAVIKD